jgi:hypothetical protein
MAGPRFVTLPIVVLLASLSGAGPASAGPKRQWQTGALVDAGRKHDNAVGGAASDTRPPANSGGYFPTPNFTPEVGRYVIETMDMRLELEAMVPVGGSDLEREVIVGQAVTFAVEKKTVYVKLPSGREHKLRLIRKSRKIGPPRET